MKPQLAFVHKIFVIHRQFKFATVVNIFLFLLLFLSTTHSLVHHHHVHEINYSILFLLKNVTH